MFETKVVEKVKTHFVFSNFFSRKSCRLWDNMSNVCRAGHRWQYGICALHAGYIRLHAHTHAHTHIHSQYAILIAFPLQQWIHERASIRYTYIISYLPVWKWI